MAQITLSSNWKRLQASMSRDKPARAPKPNSTTNISPPTTLKRKRPQPSRPYLSVTHPLKRRKMSSHPLSSTLAPTPPQVPVPDPPAQAPLAPLSPSDLNPGLHPSHKPGRYLALDCEMVTTTRDPSRLARVSIVDYHGRLVYDSFVLPSAADPVTDYKTGVSGVRASDLRPGYARPIQQVRDTVRQLLGDRVLVGHALRHDLKALEVGHEAGMMRDTARYAKFRDMAGGRTPALRVLSERVLGVRIQGGEHDSVVDARASMELYRREKGGMEDEVRRRFGARAKKRPETLRVDGHEQGDEDEDGDGILDGESEAGAEDGQNEEVETNGGTEVATKKSSRKKKRKHKSRTTRA